MTAPETFVVAFPGSAHPPLRLTGGASLLDHLTVDNSPVLFGCRAGICGTCAVRVGVVAGELAVPETEETELLDIVCPGEKAARLACQLRLTADIRLAPIG